MITIIERHLDVYKPLSGFNIIDDEICDVLFDAGYDRLQVNRVMNKVMRIYEQAISDGDTVLTCHIPLPLTHKVAQEKIKLLFEGNLKNR